MFEHHSKCKAMAMALVAMLAFCSVSVMLTDTDAAANNTETYTINLRVGDTFTYTPQVNLSTTDKATVSIVVDDGSSEGMASCYQNGVFTFTPADTTSKTVKFKASWVQGSLVQYAYQTINFHVYTGLTVNGETSPVTSISSESPSGTVIYTPSVTGGISPYTYNPTIPSALQSFIAWNGTQLVTTGTIPESAPSTSPYTITITATDAGLAAGDKSNALDAESVTITLSMTITDKYIITVQEYFETFAGDLGTGEKRTTSFPVSTNADVIGGVTSETITAVASDSNGNVDGLVSYNNGNVEVDVSKAVFTSGQTYRDYTVKISANATSSTVGNISATANVSMRIYADLSFISEPTINGSYAKPVANSSLDVLMTATFENATKITYYWGDGTVTNVNTSGSQTSTYSARHVYDSAGTYFITIYAENEKGTAKLVTLYNAYNGDSAPVDSEPEKTFFEVHGYQFIFFAVVSAFAFAAFFLFGVQSRPVVIVALVAATLSVVTYVCGDIGGVIDALKGLF